MICLLRSALDLNLLLFGTGLFELTFPDPSTGKGHFRASLLVDSPFLTAIDERTHLS
jgi:hypothetical protein